MLKARCSPSTQRKLRIQGIHDEEEDEKLVKVGLRVDKFTQKHSVRTVGNQFSYFAKMKKAGLVIWQA